MLDPALDLLGRNKHLITQAVDNRHTQAMHRGVGTMMACAAVEEYHKSHDKDPQQGEKDYLYTLMHYAFFSNSAAIASQ